MRVLWIGLSALGLAALPSIASACHHGSHHQSSQNQSSQNQCNARAHAAYHSVPRDHSHPIMRKTVMVAAPSSHAVSLEGGVIVHRGAGSSLPDYNAVLAAQARAKAQRAQLAEAKAKRAEDAAALARIEAQLATLNQNAAADRRFDRAYGYGRGYGRGIIPPGAGLDLRGVNNSKGRRGQGKGLRRGQRIPALRARFNSVTGSAGTGRGLGPLTK